MSSILDALEKANKERAARRGDPAKQELAGRQAALERQLREQQLRHRRQITLGIVAGAMALLLLAGVGATAILWQQRQAGPPPAGEQAAAAVAAATELPDVEPSLNPPPPEDGQEPARQAAAPLPVPEVTPRPSPTPAPSPAPTATPAPTPEPTTSAAYIQNTPPPSEPPAGSYVGLFQDGDILRPADLGLAVDGVMELRAGLVALINGREVRAGQKIGELHVVDIQFGVLTIDVGDGTIVRVRF